MPTAAPRTSREAGRLPKAGERAAFGNGVLGREEERKGIYGRAPSVRGVLGERLTNKPHCHLLRGCDALCVHSYRDCAPSTQNKSPQCAAKAADPTRPRPRRPTPLDALSPEIFLRVPELEAGRGQVGGARRENPPPAASLCRSAPTSYPRASHPEFNSAARFQKIPIRPPWSGFAPGQGSQVWGRTQALGQRILGRVGGEPGPASLGPCPGSQQRPQ